MFDKMPDNFSAEIKKSIHEYLIEDLFQFFSHYFSFSTRKKICTYLQEKT